MGEKVRRKGGGRLCASRKPYLYPFEEITISTTDFCLLFDCRDEHACPPSAAERPILALPSGGRVFCWPWRASLEISLHPSSPAVHVAVSGAVLSQPAGSLSHPSPPAVMKTCCGTRLSIGQADLFIDPIARPTERNVNNGAT